jgi:long-chain fatty acid transport protein
MKKLTIWSLSACLVVAVASVPALGSGFSIYEQSAKASGQAGAWVARADDAAANWYNPANLVRLDRGMQVQFGANLITIGSDTDFTIDDPYWEDWLLIQAQQVPILPPTTQSGTKFNQVENNATPIHLYFTHNVNGKIAWGIGINTPIGLSTEYDAWPVTLSHVKAELITVMVNPNVAFAINDYWSIAVGIDYIYADITEFSSEEAVFVLPLTQDPLVAYDYGATNLSGTGDDWGWNLALGYTSDAWKFGLTYRSKLDPQIDGDLDVSGFPILDGVELAPQNQKGSAILNLPDQAAVGFAYTGLDRWEFEFDISWAGWSAFQAIDIRLESGERRILVEEWDDTYALRFGTAWQLAARHQLRFGALWDKSPVPERWLRPSIPDSNRRAVTVGYGFGTRKIGLDFYYMPLWFDSISAQGDLSGKPVLNADGQIVYDGVIDGEYKSFVHLAGVTLNFKF